MNTVDKNFREFTLKSVNKEPLTKNKRKTLNKILNEQKVKNIDYLNIDVRGNELNVINGFNILEYKPKLVSIEIHDKDCPPLKNKIYKYFINNKYNLVSIYGWTYFFEFEKNKKKFILIFNICFFLKS